MMIGENLLCVPGKHHTADEGSWSVLLFHVVLARKSNKAGTWEGWTCSPRDRGLRRARGGRRLRLGSVCCVLHCGSCRTTAHTRHISRFGVSWKDCNQLGGPICD